MGPEQTTEPVPEPPAPVKTDDDFKAVQSAAAARRKRLAELDYEDLLAEDFENFLINFKQFPGE